MDLEEGYIYAHLRSIAEERLELAPMAKFEGVPKEQSLPVKLVLAHRYLYYVLAEPVLSDYEYDTLEHQLTPAEVESLGVGSDLGSSYSTEVISLAVMLLAESNAAHQGRFIAERDCPLCQRHLTKKNIALTLKCECGWIWR